MNSRQTLFFVLVSLVTITACVIPGVVTPSAPLPTLTVDAASLGTMVAATVSASVAQTEQSAPSPGPASVVIVTAESTFTPTATSTSTSTSTSTPTSTLTFTPTATSTFTPTATSTFTLTPTATPGMSIRSQSTLAKQENGSFLFVDNRAGYEIKLPAGWLVVRINEKEYLDAFGLNEATNTNVQQSLLGVQNENPNVLRLFAVDTQPSHIQNEFVSDMRFVFEGGKSISLDSGEDLQAIAEKIPTSATVFRFEVTSVTLVVAANGMQFGAIESKSAFENAAGVEVPLYQKQVFFNTRGGLQTITLTTLADLNPTLLPAFDSMLETVNLIAR